MKKLISTLCILTFCSACSLQEIKLEEPAVNTLTIGKKYRISLPEEHNSGYIWQLSENYDKTIIDNINTVWHGNEKGIDFNFNTLAAGQTTLTFIKRKYTDTLKIKHFVVKIGQ